MCSSDLTYDLDPVAGARLKKLVDLSGAKIVVSSTWRITRSLEELRSCLGAFHMWPSDVIGVTPRMNADRGYEIQAWLSSEERRVGQESGSRGWTRHQKKNAHKRA